MYVEPDRYFLPGTPPIPLAEASVTTENSLLALGTMRVTELQISVIIVSKSNLKPCLHSVSVATGICWNLLPDLAL